MKKLVAIGNVTSEQCQKVLDSFPARQRAKMQVVYTTFDEFFSQPYDTPDKKSTIGMDEAHVTSLDDIACLVMDEAAWRDWSNDTDELWFVSSHNIPRRVAHSNGWVEDID